MSDARAKPQSYTITNRSLLGRTSYTAYSIDYIQCVDKKGVPHKLAVSPSIEVRFTHHGRKKTVFYFDSIDADDTSVAGCRSRIFGMPKRIPYSAISKIEVQDGGKNYHYVKQQQHI